MELQARADRLAHLIEERLDVRGTGLEAKLRRAGRLLPKHIRAEAGLLVEAMAVQGHPKLSRQVDMVRLARAAKVVENYLLDINPWDRRRAIVLNWLAVNAFNLLVIGAVGLAVLLWRGFL